MSMRPLFQLNSRLALCASAVYPGAAVADVGTDHAYLPIWLVKTGVCSKAVALDIREGPLARARENVRRYEVEDQVLLRLSDGLDALAPGEADQLVLAGMGGELIARILSRAPWVKAPGIHLVMQPMSAAPELRIWLRKQGFALRRERAVRDAGRIYTVMEADYAGEIPAVPARYPYLGALAYTEPSAAYAQRELRHLRNQARGAEVTGALDRAAPLRTAIRDVEAWLEKGEEERQ